MSKEEFSDLYLMKIHISFEFKKIRFENSVQFCFEKKSDLKIQISFVLKKSDLKIQINFVLEHSYQVFYNYAILTYQKTYFIILTPYFTIHHSSHLLFFNSIH